ncbi:DUF805 domain-containing protein [Pseudoxanthobacter sp.]|uniref:DUF805 domain-containing protein n=1 Tax=Pseudoxanthobacter sp. TaxID=1925742 RepID=UPI002FE1FD9F
MSLSTLYFSFNGRIGRKAYWLGHIGLTVATAVIAGILLAVWGEALTGAVDGMAFELVSLPAGALIATLVLEIVFTFASLALTVKRLHDRGRTGWVALVFYAPAWLNNILSQSSAEGMVFYLVSVLSLISFLAVIWFFIELGFFRGTVGHNEYGPDPLA